jgi:hypothetical protein
MLSEETQQLQESLEDVNFYTNQCYDEVRRVGKDNGDALIDSFMVIAKKQCEFSESVSHPLLFQIFSIAISKVVFSSELPSEEH